MNQSTLTTATGQTTPKFIEWDERYCIGVPRLDKQHQHLIHLLNMLYYKVGAELEPGQIWILLDRFVEYADRHFATEEQLARNNGFPLDELYAHQKEHENYRARVEMYYAAAGKNQRHLPVDLLSFLNNWWLTHMLCTDKALGRFLSEHGVQ